jgi:hypothetical protein
MSNHVAKPLLSLWKMEQLSKALQGNKKKTKVLNYTGTKVPGGFIPDIVTASQEDNTKLNMYKIACDANEDDARYIYVSFFKDGKEEIKKYDFLSTKNDTFNRQLKEDDHAFVKTVEDVFFRGLAEAAGCSVRTSADGSVLSFGYENVTHVSSSSSSSRNAVKSFEEKQREKINHCEDERLRIIFLLSECTDGKEQAEKAGAEDLAEEFDEQIKIAKKQIEEIEETIKLVKAEKDTVSVTSQLKDKLKDLKGKITPTFNPNPTWATVAGTAPTFKQKRGASRDSSSSSDSVKEKKQKPKQEEVASSEPSDVKKEVVEAIVSPTLSKLWADADDQVDSTNV